jgi:hypothetical protein
VIVARGMGPHLRDPNWYRVSYALAVQCLEIATTSKSASTSPAKRGPRIRKPWGGGAEKDAQPGWPAEIDAKDGEWRSAFGDATAETLIELYENRAPGKEHFDQAALAARRAVEELIASAAAMLEEAGWQWVGRRPPRFVRWRRKFSPARITGRRPLLDRELVRFLSWVVEPASVVLLFSAWLVEGTNFPMAELKAAIGPKPVERPLERRKRSRDPEGWLIAYLARLVFDWPQDPARRVRAQARLGRTRYRAPREPSFRVQYNLACLFSRLAGAEEEKGDTKGAKQFISIAAGQLEKALLHLPDDQRAWLVSWAKIDPGLDDLRRMRGREFAETIARWGAGDKEEEKLEHSTRIDRIKYDPGSEILDIYFRDGRKKQFGGVPKGVLYRLTKPTLPAEREDEEKAREEVEEEFLEMIELHYPPIRP